MLVALKGHDFSRAIKPAELAWALASEGLLQENGKRCLAALIGGSFKQTSPRSVDLFILLDLKRSTDQMQSHRKSANLRRCLADNLLEVANICRVIPHSVSHDK